MGQSTVTKNKPGGKKIRIMYHLCLKKRLQGRVLKPCKDTTTSQTNNPHQHILKPYLFLKLISDSMNPHSTINLTFLLVSFATLAITKMWQDSCFIITLVWTIFYSSEECKFLLWSLYIIHKKYTFSHGLASSDIYTVFTQAFSTMSEVISAHAAVWTFQSHRACASHCTQEDEKPHDKHLTIQWVMCHQH